MPKCKTLLSLHLFGYGIYFVNNCPFRWLPSFSIFNFADLFKTGILWMGYLLEVQKDHRYPIKTKAK